MNASVSGTKPSDPSRESAVQSLYAPPRIGGSTLLYFAFVGALVVAGWRTNLDDYITAESGLGYALGIVGGVMMLLALLYPLRKRFRWMRHWGRLPSWFRVHMILGTIGPLLILYHCGFKPGATNSNITLASMLLVVMSGFVGRYIYGKIHYGLFGEKATLQHLKDDEVVTHSKLDVVTAKFPRVHEPVHKFSQVALTPSASLVHDFFIVITLSYRMWHAYFRVARRLKKGYREVAAADGWSRQLTKTRLRTARQHLLVHLMCLRKIAGFRFFERLFALWHAVHIPFIFILIATAIYHIYAVHKY